MLWPMLFALSKVIDGVTRKSYLKHTGSFPLICCRLPINSSHPSMRIFVFYLIVVASAVMLILSMIRDTPFTPSYDDVDVDPLALPLPYDSEISLTHVDIVKGRKGSGVHGDIKFQFDIVNNAQTQSAPSHYFDIADRVNRFVPARVSVPPIAPERTYSLTVTMPYAHSFNTTNAWNSLDEWFDLTLSYQSGQSSSFVMRLPFRAYMSAIARERDAMDASYLDKYFAWVIGFDNHPYWKPTTIIVLGEQGAVKSALINSARNVLRCSDTEYYGNDKVYTLIGNGGQTQGPRRIREFLAVGNPASCHLSIIFIEGPGSAARTAWNVASYPIEYLHKLLNGSYPPDWDGREQSRMALNSSDWTHRRVDAVWHMIPPTAITSLSQHHKMIVQNITSALMRNSVSHFTIMSKLDVGQRDLRSKNSLALDRKNSIARQGLIDLLAIPDGFVTHVVVNHDDMTNNFQVDKSVAKLIMDTLDILVVRVENSVWLYRALTASVILFTLFVLVAIFIVSEWIVVSHQHSLQHSLL